MLISGSINILMRKVDGKSRREEKEVANILWLVGHNLVHLIMTVVAMPKSSSGQTCELMLHRPWM